MEENNCSRGVEAKREVKKIRPTEKELTKTEFTETIRKQMAGFCQQRERESDRSCRPHFCVLEICNSTKGTPSNQPQRCVLNHLKWLNLVSSTKNRNSSRLDNYTHVHNVCVNTRKYYSPACQEYYTLLPLKSLAHLCEHVYVTCISQPFQTSLLTSVHVCDNSKYFYSWVGF